jgi:uncharacterized protein (DUF849 family)
MLLKACLNGARGSDEHPALPVTAEQLAVDGAACVRAGAGALHVHPRDGAGRESLHVAVVDPVVCAVREACGVPIGVATGAWVEPDPERRAELVSRWTMPDFASVNLSEAGAVGVMQALLAANIGVEAGVWSVEDARRLTASGLAARVTRVLVEVFEGSGSSAAARARRIDAALDRLAITAGRLHHGERDATWPVLRQALVLGRDTRIGFEDTLTLPDGTTAQDNAQLVGAAATLRGELPAPGAR